MARDSELRTTQAGQVRMGVLGQVERGDDAWRDPRVRRERPDAGHRAQQLSCTMTQLLVRAQRRLRLA
jgi:hypothetical protein